MVWAPLIILGLAAAGKAYFEYQAADEQIKATEKANKIMNEQWAKEFEFTKKKELTDRIVQSKDQFRTLISDNAVLRDNLLNIWTSKNRVR